MTTGEPTGKEEPDTELLPEIPELEIRKGKK